MLGSKHSAYPVSHLSSPKRLPLPCMFGLSIPISRLGSPCFVPSTISALPLMGLCSVCHICLSPFPLSCFQGFYCMQRESALLHSTPQCHPLYCPCTPSPSTQSLCGEHPATYLLWTLGGFSRNAPEVGILGLKACTCCDALIMLASA